MHSCCRLLRAVHCLLRTYSAFSSVFRAQFSSFAHSGVRMSLLQCTVGLNVHRRLFALLLTHSWPCERKSLFSRSHRWINSSILSWRRAKSTGYLSRVPRSCLDTRRRRRSWSSTDTSVDEEVKLSGYGANEKWAKNTCNATT